jgi:hypothetical protein
MDKSCHYFGQCTSSLRVIVKAVIGLAIIITIFYCYSNSR